MTAPPLALITGAPGWLGSRLVEALVRGVPGARSPLGIQRRVRCLVRPGADVASLASLGEVEIVEGDLTDAASLEAFAKDAAGATVFHAAGIIHPMHGTREILNVNVQGTANVLAAAVGARARRFVFVSSNSPIGVGATRAQVFDETSPYHPYMTYGRSKQRAEEIVNDASARGAIETVIIRPPWFYGPGQPARQTRFVEMIRRGRVPIVGDGTNVRSVAYVDNICHGLLQVEAVAAAAGQTYWIADRVPQTMNAIVETIERVLVDDFQIPVARKRVRLPNVVSEAAWLCDRALQSMGLYQQEIHVLSEMNKTIACSTAKAEREVGYAPEVELREGWRRSIAWMREQGWRPS
jgi:nucleoside-diphosphate-sugar epimerase